MRYSEYKNYTKVYVVVHNTGTGVMEDPYIEHEVVYETDFLEEAEAKASELKLKHNSKAEIESTWCSNTYHINVNILSDKGKELKEKFSKEFDERLKMGMKNSKYNVHKVGDLTFFTDNSEICVHKPEEIERYSDGCVYQACFKCGRILNV
jgi:hypothetical protein